MEERGKEPAPFDERAALEELERVRREIERYKMQRKALGEEFEQFTRSFKTQSDTSTGSLPSPPALSEPLMPPVQPAERAPQPPTQAVQPEGRAPEPPAIRALQRPLEPVAPVVSPPETPPPPVPPAARLAPAEYVPESRTPIEHVSQPPLEYAPSHIPVAEPASEYVPSHIPIAEPAQEPLTPDVEPAPTPVAEVTATPARRQSAGRTLALIGGALLLVLGGFAAWTFWPNTPEPSSSARTPATPAPAPPPRPEPPASAAVPAPPVTELITTAPVWVRVVADGETVLERELPADSRVPLTAEKTIVIRAGDAGAVRLTIAGQDQGTLGQAGQVLTRRFTLPGEAAR
jgi:hypothetical protein